MAQRKPARDQRIRNALNGRNIVFLGMMGSGKSAIGKMVARRLGFEFRDADGNVTGTTTYSEIEEVVICFTPGTTIATRRGEIPVQQIKVGDLVVTRDNGLQPVFFGETLSALTTADTALPSLTYLLSFEDEAAKDAAWDSFRNAPEWKELSGRPEYADSKLIRKITDIALKPAAFSQL